MNKNYVKDNFGEPDAGKLARPVRRALGRNLSQLMRQGAVIRLYQEHPKAFNDVTLGLIFLVVASGGGIAALLGT